MRDSTADWVEFLPVFSVRLPDGTTTQRPVMRRKRPDGSWEYRTMTPEEEADFVSKEAW